MAINYGILQPVKTDAAPLMGSAPSASAGSLKSAGGDMDIGKEVTGFMSAFGQGQQLQSNAETLKQQEMKTEAMQQEQMDAESLRAAAKEGTDAYRAQVYQQNPVQGVEFDTKLSQMNEANERVKGVSMDNYKKLVPIQAQFYGNVAGGRDDAEKDQIWKMQYNDLPDNVKKTVPANYTPNNFAAGMLTNQNAIADLAPKKPKSESVLGQLQSDANAMQTQINQMKQRGMDTTQQEQQLAQLQQAAAQKAERKAEVNNLEAEVDKKEAERYGTSMDAYDSSKNLTSTLDLMETQLKKVPNMAMGPMVNFLKANANSEEAKTYNSLVNYAAMQLRMATMKGAGAMSNADREFLESMVGGLAVTKNSATQIIKNMREIANRAGETNYRTADGIMKRTPSYQAWKEANPEPFAKKETMNQGTQSSGGFQEGQEYQDAKGNKARYINGKWEAI